MSEEIVVNKNLPTKEIYGELLPQIAALIEPSKHLISNLANFTAAVFNSFGKMSWVEFYLRKGDKLFLGPFQGNTACTMIRIGEGICGTAAERLETVIVPDVNTFPGHIYCDVNTKSEIVLPVISGNELYGVLDIDSYEYSAFDQEDYKYLAELINILTKKINSNKVSLA